MSGAVYLSASDRAVWQCAVYECDECDAMPDEELCDAHDLDIEAVALRYSGASDAQSGTRRTR